MIKKTLMWCEIAPKLLYIEKIYITINIDIYINLQICSKKNVPTFF